MLRIHTDLISGSKRPSYRVVQNEHPPALAFLKSNKENLRMIVRFGPFALVASWQVLGLQSLCSSWQMHGSWFATLESEVDPGGSMRTPVVPIPKLIYCAVFRGDWPLNLVSLVILAVWTCSKSKKKRKKKSRVIYILE